jgi:hypothetical protein
MKKKYRDEDAEDDEDTPFDPKYVKKPIFRILLE